MSNRENVVDQFTVDLKEVEESLERTEHCAGRRNNDRRVGCLELRLWREHEIGSNGKKKSRAWPWVPVAKMQ